MIAGFTAVAATADAEGLEVTATVPAQPPAGGGAAQVRGCGLNRAGGGGAESAAEAPSAEEPTDDLAAAADDDATITLEPPAGVTVTSGANPANLGSLPDTGVESCRQWNIAVADSPACAAPRSEHGHRPRLGSGVQRRDGYRERGRRQPVSAGDERDDRLRQRSRHRLL